MTNHTQQSPLNSFFKAIKDHLTDADVKEIDKAATKALADETGEVYPPQSNNN